MKNGLLKSYEESPGVLKKAKETSASHRITSFIECGLSMDKCRRVGI